MKVELVTQPWGNTWINGLRKVFHGHEFSVSETPTLNRPDIRLYGWADGQYALPGSTNIVFMRRYELFTGKWKRIEWDFVDYLICVNDWIANRVREYFTRKNIKTEVLVIYNAVDPDNWTYAERKPNGNIGMSCHVHMKKNIPLALQILGCLPDYELHIAGAVQDSCVAEYINYIGKKLKRRIYLYGHVDYLDQWWDEMGFCLSSSISEGNPNNVNEAMAKGIKPVVHCWPGAEKQYPEECLYSTVDEAVEIIHGGYNSARYREWAMDEFSMTNLEKVRDLAIGAATQRRSK